MTATTTTMASALTALRAATATPTPTGASVGGWRWMVRQRMAAVRDALMEESPDSDDGWLAARGGTAFRERNLLLGRLGELGARVLTESDVDVVRSEVGRLVVDVTHHLQRLSDLAYDAVELELGGSE